MRSHLTRGQGRRLTQICHRADVIVGCIPRSNDPRTRPLQDWAPPTPGPTTRSACGNCGSRADSAASQRTRFAFNVLELVRKRGFGCSPRADNPRKWPESARLETRESSEKPRAGTQWVHAFALSGRVNNKYRGLAVRAHGQRAALSRKA